MIFSIVGSAGRKLDGNRLTKHHFQGMLECARSVMFRFPDQIDTLVSGGAAWSDHIAVRLFLNKEVPKLNLYFPTHFNMEIDQYDEYPLNDWEKKRGFSTGQVSNWLHSKFSKTMEIDSRHEITMALQQGATGVTIAGGFYGRNTQVAKADIILAMTFGQKEFLKDGGTCDTVRKYLARIKKAGLPDHSFHFDLNTGELFRGAKVL